MNYKVRQEKETKYNGCWIAKYDRMDYNKRNFKVRQGELQSVMSVQSVMVVQQIKETNLLR